MNTVRNPRAPEGAPTILLAEDDLEMRKLLSWSLMREGYRTIECSDGLMLMRKLGLLGPVDRLQPHDLIISDVRMPGLTGLQVLECAREFADFPPIILITAFPDDASRNHAARLGAVATVVKPFDIEDLLGEVRKIVPRESWKQQRESDEFETDDAPPYPFEITFRHGSGSEATKDYIRSVASKLRPFINHVVNGRIIIDQSDKAQRHDHRYGVTLMLSTRGKPIVVKYDSNRGVTEESLYMAVNVAFGMATRKLKHAVEKRQARRRHGARKGPSSTVI